MTRKTKAELEAALATATDQLEAAQGLISNGADWDAPRPHASPEALEWRTAARRWLDGYAESLHAGRDPEPEPAEEPEPAADGDQGADRGPEPEES